MINFSAVILKINLNESRHGFLVCFLPRLPHHSYTSGYYDYFGKQVALQNSSMDFSTGSPSDFRGYFLPVFRTGVPQAKTLFAKRS